MNEERLAVVETQIDNMQKDISDLKQVTKLIYNMSFNIEQMCKEMKEMNNRITTLEKEPVDDMKSLKKDITKYIITTILGLVIGYLATKIL